MTFEITEEEIHAMVVEDDRTARRLLFTHLVNAAHEIKYEISDGESFVYHFCHLVRPQLHKLGIQTGKAGNDQVLLALARAGGHLHYTKGSGPDPARLTRSLIVAVCNECLRRGGRWTEGEAEFERRKALKGLHGFVWALRDRGLLQMNPERYVRDPEPRFP